MIRIKISNFLVFFILTCVALSFCIFSSPMMVNAMSDVWYAPTCEANFEESSAATLLSKTTIVSYNSGNASLKTCYKYSTYNPTSLACSLPVYCQQFDVSSYKASLTLNGSNVTPSYGYSSKSVFLGNSESYADILALREQLSEIDPNILIHEFAVSASEEASFSFSLQKTDHIIYTFYRYSSTTNPQTYDVTVSPSHPISFVVFGNKPIINASELCSVNYTEKSLDTYVAEMASIMEEMTNGVDCTELVTHRVNEFLSSNNSLSFDNFLNSCYLRSYAFLDYSLLLPSGESTIIIEQPMAVGLNSLFNPKVYVGKIYAPEQTAPFSFSIETEQYVVDSTLSLNNNCYAGLAKESITIAFCEVKNPTPINGSNSVQWAPWRITVVSVCGVIGIAAFVVLIVSLVQLKKTK